MSLTPFSDPESPYLTAKLGEIKLYLVHYSSFEQAQEKWEIRKARVHKDNMFFIMTDRNHCDEADIKAFDALPYANKVCFTHIPYPQYESTYYLHGSEEDEYVKDVSGYIHQWWIKRYYDHFDFVTWLNEGGHNWPK